MTTQRRFAAVLAAPTLLATIAGAAAACPPESESGEKQPVRVIELGKGGEKQTVYLAERLAAAAAREPMMSVFGAQAAEDDREERRVIVHGQPGVPGEPGVRVLLDRPTQTALTEQNLFVQTQQEAARADSAQREVRKLRGMYAPAQAAPVPPVPPMPPVPSMPGFGGGAGAHAESRVIVIGPDGNVQQFMLDEAPARIKAEVERRAAQPFKRAQGLSIDADRMAKLELERAAAGAAAARRPGGVWIGIEMAEPDGAIAKYFELEPGQATQIAKVHEHSPAAKAGLQAQDIIVGVNGERAAGPQALSEAVAASKAGDKLRVMVLRKGQERELVLRPAPREQAAAEAGPEKAVEATESGRPARGDLEDRMARLERMLERLLEEKSQD